MADKPKATVKKSASFNFGANKKAAKPRKKSGVRVHRGVSYGS